VSAQLRVGVSPTAYERLDPAMAQGIRFVPVSGAPDASVSHEVDVLWRRQGDRTRWLVDVLGLQRGVRWVHTDTAGVDRLPLDDLRNRGVLLTRARGVYTSAVSEWAVAAMLMGSKRLDVVVRNSDARLWREPRGVQELAARTVVIVGLGSIGTAIARASRGLGMHIVGVVRRPPHDPHDERRDHVDALVAVTEDWQRYLERASYIVISTPLTRETVGLVGETTIRRTAPGAWLVNVSRGEVVDEAALCAALDSGHLAGAVLDCFVEEPLPAGHPLWGRPNVVVSPHASSQGDRGDCRSLEHFLKELGRYVADVPSVSRVDYDRGY